MPIYNGATGVASAIKSLLDQTYRDFTLVISDNGSTDETPRIARTFADRDRRVQLLREEHNRGPTWNFNRLLAAGRNHPYFMWAAHDDLWAPTYISACIKSLETHSSAVLCGARARFVDSEGRATGEEDQGINSTGLNAFERAINYVEHVEMNSIFYGVYRTAKLPPGEMKNRVGGDQAFVLDVSLNGDLITLPNILMTRRKGGASRSAASIYRALGLRQTLPARLFRVDVYRAFLDVASSTESLNQQQRRQLRRRLVEIGIRRHVLSNLKPRRLRWWLINGGRARIFKE